MPHARKTADWIPVAEAAEQIGVDEKILWDAVDIAQVKEVFDRQMRPHFTGHHMKAIRDAAARLPKPRIRNVYIIRSSADKQFKIGMSYDAIDRLKALQTGTGKALKLVHVEAGSSALERKAHLALAPHRIRGEWFRATPTVRAFVAMAIDRGIQAAIDQLLVDASLDNSLDNQPKMDGSGR